MDLNYQFCCGRNEAHLPPGFRFHPTDEELITYYLLKKVLDSNFTSVAIAEADLNKCEPWHLPGKAYLGENDQWYFFSLRDRKYPTGLRTNRATEAGYWKATGKDRGIYCSKTCALVGMKKTLVFYRGRAPKGEKSNWVMHEYRLDGKLANHYLSRNSEAEWVISRVFHRSGSGSPPAAGGGKKRPSAGVNTAPEVSSPSLIYLPPLLEPSTVSADHDNCSYISATNAKEHVPCFSTTAAPRFKHNSLFELQPPPSSLSSLILDTSSDSRFLKHSVGISAFSGLRLLQENPNLPFFFPAVAPPPMQGGADLMPGYGSIDLWPPPDNDKICASVLDCTWNY